jgi:hypothetical protein
MDWKAILWDWRFIIILILGAILFALFEWSSAKEIILKGCLMAKKLAKDAVLSSGQAQEDWVVFRIYPCLPAPMRVFVSEATFRKIVRWLYGKAKDYLDDGELNGSISQGGTL